MIDQDRRGNPPSPPLQKGGERELRVHARRPSAARPCDWHRRVVRASSLCLWVLVTVGLAGSACAAATEVQHDLRVRLEPERRALVGEDRIRISGAGTIEIRLADRFRVTRSTFEAGSTARLRKTGPDAWQADLGRGGPHELRIEYAGELDPLVRADHRGVLSALPPMADARGTYLPAGSAWYPEIAGPAVSFRITLDLPAGQRGVVPGDPVEAHETAGRAVATFAFERAPEALALMAGPYEVRERSLYIPTGDVAVRTYFHPEVASLADGYLDAAAGYLARYSRDIGPYPFKAFSIVSSPLPTGFGMPTLTYLGLDVIRLPFIRSTSLGHEVLHSWWGNGVLVDWRQGNWCEGLTTFMADYAYAEEAGPETARTMRLDWLREFSAVPPAEDFPLARFRARHHGASQAVGYHKAAFLFLMLRDRMGARAFDDALRRFFREHRGRAVGWNELRRTFESIAGQPLRRFFEQWLLRQGAPTVTLEAANSSAGEPGVRVRVAQTDPPYALRVPLRVATDAGETSSTVELVSKRQDFLLGVDSPARSVSLDPDFWLFRRLGPEEAPPILRQVMLHPDTVTVIPTSDRSVREAALRLAARLLDHPVRLAPEGGAPPDAPLLLVGLRADVDQALRAGGLAGPPDAVSGTGTAAAWATQGPRGRPVLVVAAEDAAALAALTGPLPHYGGQGYLAFDGTRVIVRGAAPARPSRIPVQNHP